MAPWGSGPPPVPVDACQMLDDVLAVIGQMGFQSRDTCVAGALRRDLRAGQRATR
jgi:hypothetical protein